jgi:uncharacterized membrane protein
MRNFNLRNPRTLAITAVMTAITYVMTRIVQVPTPARGFIHLGDAAVLFTAFAFGPWVGMIAGALGTALADLTSGYAQWAVFTLVIHGLEGYLAGRIANGSANIGRLALASLVGGLVLVPGYFIAGVILSGVGGATGELLGNVFQILGGAILSIPLYLAVRRAYPRLSEMSA